MKPEMMYSLAAGIYCRFSKETLSKILKELDLVIADLDGCIFPGITKVTMYRNICFLLTVSKKVKNYILLARLLASGILITLLKIGQLLHTGITNRHLIVYYARVIKKVPASCLEKAAASVPPRSYKGARETLQILSRKAKLGIITQALDLVLNEYVKQFRDGLGNVIDFWDGNVFSDLSNCKSKPEDTFILHPDDKGSRAVKRINQFGSKRVMVIGHNRNDLGMIKIAREQNGIIVGFNPTADIEEFCHIVVRNRNWIELRELFHKLLIPIS